MSGHVALCLLSSFIHQVFATDPANSRVLNTMTFPASVFRKFCTFLSDLPWNQAGVFELVIFFCAGARVGMVGTDGALISVYGQGWMSLIWNGLSVLTKLLKPSQTSASATPCTRGAPPH
ncbi:uncharacterized protein BJ212DRAFT_1305086 [Suillus subaureus]|uniref:Uncharacterized protein n=1 Tax=Suillus subaureus TaxID=48587 RepID=A0A9P7DRI9_9AGAM|nr:uncharacterized protein BJ212DRAFT_1305086 [Suillus subaureus]KAG1801247.1 hypothetical protein BJ212DRAFT_1305086 [Suillus subaureus]